MDLARISSCSYPVRERPAAEALQTMADAGLTRIDLWGNLPHFSVVSTECDLEKLRDTAAATGVQIANLGSYPGSRFGSDDPLVQEPHDPGSQRLTRVGRERPVEMGGPVPVAAPDPPLAAVFTSAAGTAAFPRAASRPSSKTTAPFPSSPPPVRPNPTGRHRSDAGRRWRYRGGRKLR